MSQEFKYDVFLSHSSKDKPVVRELAEKLKADGIRVWFDEWIIQPGDSIPIKINKGLKESRVLVLVTSANASESDWVTFEHQTILFNDPTNKTRRFIPLSLDDSETPFGIKQFAYIDWRRRDDDQYQRLLSAVKNEKTELPESQSEETTKTDTVKILKGHSLSVFGVSISADGKLIISGSVDKTIRIWETESGKCLKVLEGHSDAVLGVSISADSKLIISGSRENTIRIWRPELLSKFRTKTGSWSEVRGIDEESKESYKFYTNAKVLLVGDSGVGKSGLAYRLTQNEYVPTISTDGVWATQMNLPANFKFGLGH